VRTRMSAFYFLIIYCFAGFVAYGQATPDVDQGFKPYGSYEGGNVDTVNLSNGNLTLHIPILSYPQLGKVKLDFALVYNAQPWRQVLENASTNPDYIEVYGNQPCVLAGVVLTSNLAWCGTGTTYNNAPQSPPSVPVNSGFNHVAPIQTNTTGATATWLLFTAYDPFGGAHQFVPTTSAGTTFMSLDATGMSLNNGLVTPDGVSHTTNTDIETGEEVDEFGNAVQGGTSTGWTDSVGRSIPAPQSTGVGSCPAGTSTATSWTVPAYASSGNGTATYISCFTVVSIASNFPFGDQTGKSPIYSNGTASPSLLTALILPNGQAWKFSYDSEGDLQQLTFPTGGTITYQWAAIPACSPTGQLKFSMGVTSRTVNPGNGEPSSTWSYSLVSGVNTVQDPMGNTTVHSFLGGSACSLYESNTAYYQGSSTSGKLIKNVSTQYSGATNVNDLDATEMNVEPIKVTTTLASGQTSTITKTYDSGISVWNQTWNRSESPTYYTLIYGSLVSTDDYDFGVPTSGTPTRTASTTWEWQKNSAYLTAGLLDIPASKIVLNSASQQASYTTYTYDETAYSPGGVLGQPTTTVQYLGGNPGPTTHTGWLSNGEKSYVIDADGHTNSNGHTIDYGYSVCDGSVVTSTTDALNHKTSGAYDCNSGLVTSITDPNLQTSTFSYDELSRITQAVSPAITLPGGQTGNPTTTFTYNDSANTVTRTVTASPDPTQTTEVVFDGLGRELHRYITDGSLQDTIDTTYDSLGREGSVSNPYRSTSDPTYGTTSFTYDALGRKVLQTQPDGSSEQWCYDGVGGVSGQTICSSNLSSMTSDSWVDYADETGRHWQHVSDSFGRLVDVMEPGPTTNTPSLQTEYSYDALNNLLSVNQIGASGETPHTRSFTYNSLSRLLCASNPENNNPNGSQGNTVQPCPSSSSGSIPTTGVTSYVYDPNGNVTTKTDARGISASITYDNLNRPTLKTYNDGFTLPVTYSYDSSSVSGAANTIGHLTSESVMNGSTLVSQRNFYAYNAVGEVTSLQECSPANCSSTSYQVSYLYDLAGKTVSSTNGLPTATFNGVSVPSVTLASTYDGVGRLSTIQSSWTGSSAYPGTIFEAGSSGSSSPAYTAAGGLQNALLGINAETSEPVATLARTYDDRLRVTSETDAPGTVVPATASTGSISISGTEQSVTTPATYASGSISITGTEGTTRVCTTPNPHLPPVCNTEPDTGTLTVTINGFTASASYGSGSTDDTVAQALATSLSQSGSPVSASTGGTNVVTLTSLVSGPTGDYSFTITNGAVFFGAGTALTGGEAASTTYDSGSVSVTIGSSAPVVVSWGSTSSADSVADSLQSALSGSTVTASVSNNVVTLTSKTTGTAGNVSISCSAAHSGSTPISFTPTCSGMNGGTAGSGSASIYSYSIPANSGYATNGDLVNVTDSVTGGWSYGYDNLNRLTSATGASGTYNQAFGVSGIGVTWTYDSFGNRKSQSSSSANIPSEAANYTSSTNQFTTTSAAPGGVTYDNAGNITYDGVNTYKYDAEDRVCAVFSQVGGFTTYVYDGEGNRVAKGSIGSLSCSMTGFVVSNSYIYGAKNELLTQMNAGGVWDHSNVYAEGGLLATYHDTNTYLEFNDWLGTKRAEVSAAGCLETWGNLGFGDDLSPVGNCPDAAPQHYTGKERDTESGLDYMEARYYGSSMGRFMSPDPILSSGHDDDPQTWNKYAYARNNPLRYSDPTGLDFSLGCGTNNGTTCQGGNTYYKDGNGNYQETLIHSGANGSLSDQSGNSYTANVSGSGVTFSGNGGSNVAGTFVNGTAATTINGSGALSGFTFNFTYSEVKSGISAGGTFSYGGTPDQTESALQKAGFTHYTGDDFNFLHPNTKDYRSADYRSAGAAGTGAGSGHFTVHEPWVLVDNQVFMFKPPSSPSGGDFHLGETNPYTGGLVDHTKQVINHFLDHQ